MQKVRTLLGLLFLFGLFVYTTAVAQEPAAESTAVTENIELSLGVSPGDVRLEDMLAGTKRVSFSPMVANEFSILGKAQEKYWLRIKVTLPANPPEMLLSLERRGVNAITLYLVEKNGNKTSVIPLQSSRTPHSDNMRGQWPTRIVFQLPSVVDGAVLYAEMEAAGHLHLHPMLLTTEQQAVQSNSDDSFFTALYLFTLIFICLAFYRQLRVAESQAVLISLSLIAALFGFFAYNTHLPLFLKTEFINKPLLPYALLMLAAAPFLSASSYFSGLHARWSEGAVWVTRTAVVLMGLSILLVSTTWLSVSQMQLVTSLTWTLCVALAMCIYVFDVRSSRWSALIVGAGLLAAIWSPSLVISNSLPSTRMNVYGFEVFFLILMAVYLFLPWLRSALQSRGSKRRILPPVELTPDKKIANARIQLLQGLQSALENANESDVEWIAYRRLLEGLKPVLPQIASAVIAKNYHNEDFLIVEPKSATERYQALINQRSNLLKNLSRMSAPQQIRLDFDGPDGPLEAVSLAVIPLPIAKPGWGALIVEREADRTYSEIEMDIGTEFAALATTAGDEAAEAMLARHSKEMDVETGVYNREKFDAIVKKLLDVSVMQRKQLSMLCVSIDNFDGLVREKPDLKSEILQSLASAMYDEIDYGATLARFDVESFAVLLPDRNIGEARELAQRLCNIASQVQAESAPEMKFTMSIGVSHLQAGERVGKMMLERTSIALAKARQYGGNQIQAISST